MPLVVFYCRFCRLLGA